MKFSSGNISNLSAFMLVSTFFSLWIAVYFDKNAEEILSYFFVFSFGILHGANDLKLLQKTNEMGKQTFFYRALLSYLVVIGVTALLFSLLPLAALVFFVLASGYHFGEQHWVSRVKTVSRGMWLFYTIYGLLIFFLLFFCNATEVGGIIKEVTGIYLPKSFFLYGLIFTGAISLIGLVKFQMENSLLSPILEELFYLLVFYVVFQTASLLWAFSIYFVIWHSIPSLLDQVQFLSGEISKKSMWSYLKTSFMYWAISILGLALLYYFLKDQHQLFLSILIYFLAAITFPHVLVMTKLKRS